MLPSLADDVVPGTGSPFAMLQAHRCLNQLLEVDPRSPRSAREIYTISNEAGHSEGMLGQLDLSIKAHITSENNVLLQTLTRQISILRSELPRVISETISKHNDIDKLALHTLAGGNPSSWKVKLEESVDRTRTGSEPQTPNDPIHGEPHRSDTREAKGQTSRDFPRTTASSQSCSSDSDHGHLKRSDMMEGMISDPREYQLSSRTQKTQLFEDSKLQEIKRNVLKNRKEKQSRRYADYYARTGIFQRIARHSYFEYLTLFVIAFNAVWLSFEIDGNTASTLMDMKSVFVIGDSIFLGFYSSELLIRLLAFANKVDCLKDYWFLFDALLVFLYLVDPFIISFTMATVDGGNMQQLPTGLLRVIRLGRFLRLIRILRSFPTLMTMVKSMTQAMLVVSYTLGLLLLMAYLFAILLRSLVQENSAIEKEFFPNVLDTVHTLIVFGTFLDDLGRFMFTIRDKEDWGCLTIAWIYVICSSLMILNMLIGVLCEVISAVAAEEKEASMIEETRIRFSRLLEYAAEGYDSDVISWDSFRSFIELEETSRALEHVNVDPVSLVTEAEDWFFDSDAKQLTMTFDDFMDMILAMRGDRQAKVKDVLSIGKRVSLLLVSFKRTIDNLDQKIDLSLGIEHSKFGDKWCRPTVE